MPLMIRFRGFSESYKGTLVGMDRGNYLICSVPHVKGIWVKVHKENHMIVRYIHKGVVYGFKGTLISVIEDPAPILFMYYPDDIETVRLRKHERINCLIPATVEIDGVFCEGAILDLSVGGCSFAFAVSPDDEPAEIETGKEGILSAQIPGFKNERSLKMDVVNVRREGKRIAVGTRFKDVDADILNSLQSYIAVMATLSN
jgi:c-di-GMP-binding flagellar brake protein YcgR